MPRNGINRNQVLDAIKELQDQNIVPTAAKVRAVIGSGSLVTVHKHLNEWKTSKLLKSKKATVNELSTSANLYLEQELSRAQQLNQELQAKLSQAELEALKLTSLSKKDAQALAVAIATIDTLTKAQTTLSQVVTESKAMAEQMLAQVSANYEQIIANLREDLTALNAASLQAVREASQAAQDAWLNEKVKLKEMEVTVNELKTKNVTLTLELKAAQDINAPLRYELTKKNYIIEKCVSWEQLQALEGSTNVGN